MRCPGWLAGWLAGKCLGTACMGSRDCVAIPRCSVVGTRYAASAPGPPRVVSDYGFSKEKVNLNYEQYSSDLHLKA